MTDDTGQPTVDRLAALDAARETRCEGRRIYNRERARRSLAECENQAIAAALTAAASEARAAAIEEALSAAADELIRLYDRSADRENFIKTSKKRMEIVSALDTPAQAET